MNTLVPGCATTLGTKRYMEHYGAGFPAAHYSDFLHLHYKLSSLGIGSFPGAATDAVDANYADIVEQAALAGINVFDTAAHYRYGRSARATGEGLRRAFAKGVARDGVFVVAKGGFLTFDGGPPADFPAWFRRHIVAPGLGTEDDLTQAHLLSPAYIDRQIDQCRECLGLATLDAFLVDQPEVHIPRIGKEMLNRRLLEVFTALEQAVRQERIAGYGIATFHGLRVATDHSLFQSFTSLLGLAEKAAQAVGGERAKHHFRVAQMPFNQVMIEGFSRFSQATGQGNVASAIQAAHQLKVYVMASHSLLKGHLAAQSAEVVAQALAGLSNAAQRALQFNRSTPGLGTSLVGVSTPAHLEDVLAVARTEPLPRAEYLKMYARTE